MSTSPTNQTYWTEEKVSDLLNHLDEILGKLEQQSIYYQRQNEEFDFMQTEEYKAEQQSILDQSKVDQEALDELQEERHKELVDSMNNVATVAGDETTSTTLIESFDEFRNDYGNNVMEFNEMLWLVFITFLIITAFKQLGNQIWRV